MEDLFRLVRENKVDILNNILSEGILNVRNAEKQSLLQQAIVSQNFDIAKILILKNINVNNKDLRGQTALHYLPLYKSIEIAKLILENGGDVNIKDSYGNTPLWTAIFNSRGDNELVILYLEFNAKIGIVNNSKKTCYDLIRMLGNKELLEIVEKYK